LGVRGVGRGRGGCYLKACTSLGGDGGRVRVKHRKRGGGGEESKMRSGEAEVGRGSEWVNCKGGRVCSGV